MTYEDLTGTAGHEETMMPIGWTLGVYQEHWVLECRGGAMIDGWHVTVTPADMVEEWLEYHADLLDLDGQEIADIMTNMSAYGVVC